MEEIESLKQIINLLLQDSHTNLTSNTGSETSEPTHTPNIISTQMTSTTQEPEKWTMFSTKSRKKNSPQKNSTETNNTYALPTTNRYELLNLLNMVDQDADQLTPGSENPSITPNHEDHLRQQPHPGEGIEHEVNNNRVNYQAYTIPTLLNGKVEYKHSNVIQDKGFCVYHMQKEKSEQYQVVMVGDSFLNRIRDNVDLSLNSKCSTYSLVKPGSDLKTLLDSANSTVGTLSPNDVIVVCGGSNDFNQNNVRPAITCIRDFLVRHNQTNVIIANVPIRHELPYHSPINKRIRSYNSELLHLTSKFAREHGQVALIEIDFDRSFHTHHGLHFNRLGRLLFSNKTAQTIHTMLRDKLEPNIDPKDKCAHHEEENQEVATNYSEDKEEEGKCNLTDGDSGISQAPPGDNTISVSKPNLERQGTTTRVSVPVSEIEQPNLKVNEVMEMQDPEDDREDKDEEDECNDYDGEPVGKCWPLQVKI
jgi:hypothetical protein